MSYDAGDRIHADEAVFYELEIARGRLQAIADDAGTVLARTAASNVVREAKDFACAVMTPDGHTVVQSRESIPVFLSTMTHTWQAMSDRQSMADLEPGDVLATNDPWMGTGQLNDLTLIAPVFSGAEIVGYAAAVAHLTDVGGTGLLGHATQVFEEGLRLPVFKLSKAGEIEQLALDIISANVRRPADVLGDVHAMLNAISVMTSQLHGISEELGSARLIRAYDELERRTERHLRERIAALPDGTHTATLSPSGGFTVPFVLAVRATVAGDHLTLDFEGSSDQVKQGINSSISFTRAYALYGCKCLLAPDAPLNEGIFRPISIVAPPGTIVNSAFPAAGSARSDVGHYLPTLIYRALAEVAGDAIIGECGAPRASLVLRGTSPDESMFSMSITCAGGFGARSDKDGLSGVPFPTNVRGVAIEMLELYNPILFEEKELAVDTGGAGQWRGGLGQRLSVRVVGSDCEGFVRVQWTEQGPHGVHGGESGGRGLVRVNGEDAPMGRVMALHTDDVVTVQSPGSGGFGPPQAREPERVEADVRRGYVSPEAARAIYGWAGTAAPSGSAG
jgi:N-methylhydantoinase B